VLNRDEAVMKNWKQSNELKKTQSVDIQTKTKVLFTLFFKKLFLHSMKKNIISAYVFKKLI